MYSRLHSSVSCELHKNEPRGKVNRSRNQRNRANRRKQQQRKSGPGGEVPEERFRRSSFTSKASPMIPGVGARGS